MAEIVILPGTPEQAREAAGELAAELIFPSYSPTLLDQVISLLHVRKAMIEAYWTGLAEFSPKN